MTDVPDEGREGLAAWLDWFATFAFGCRFIAGERG